MCTIHSKVVEDHQKELQPGAVLVLRQVGEVISNHLLALGALLAVNK